MGQRIWEPLTDNGSLLVLKQRQELDLDPGWQKKETQTALHMLVLARAVNSKKQLGMMPKAGAVGLQPLAVVKQPSTA